MDFGVLLNEIIKYCLDLHGLRSTKDNFEFEELERLCFLSFNARGFSSIQKTQR